MKITGTFIDEISHDIPHQNWGAKEWAKDFEYMHTIGIDTVILIRCGYKNWMTYPSKYLKQNHNIVPVYDDLVQLFLDLCKDYNFDFFFGLYDSGAWYENQNFELEAKLNLNVIDEVWQRYGDHPAFKGWYLNHEISTKSADAVRLYQLLGNHCKHITSLPILISPYIEGPKALPSYDSNLSKAEFLRPEQHRQEWNDIFSQIAPIIDIVAFQDGHVHYDLLADYLAINKSLADAFHLECWSNLESFDRDMPIKFLPIKWNKLRFKLDAATEAKVDKLITFEFSHFMSPQSSYIQAHHLYNRYSEYLSNEL